MTSRSPWRSAARSLPALLVAALALPSPAGDAAPAARGSASSALMAELETIVGRSGAEVGLAMRALDGRDEAFLNADRVFHAASTMKVAVMVELFAQDREGRLRLDDPLPVRNTFASVVDGSPYALDAAEDSDHEVYKAVGSSLTLRRLCRAMIAVSSNLAANLLIEKVGVERVRARLAALGVSGLDVRRGVEDDKAYERGIVNTTTARGLLQLLEAIARGQAVDEAASREMVEILKEQRFRDAIPAGLPPGTPVAHKTGAITRIHHDAAIVYGPRPYVLVVLVRGIEDQKQSAALIASLARAVHAAVGGPPLSPAASPPSAGRG